MICESRGVKVGAIVSSAGSGDSVSLNPRESRGVKVGAIVSPAIPKNFPRIFRESRGVRVEAIVRIP